MAQCTAKSKRTGDRCQRPAMGGSTVCYHHGGKTPRGMASPNFRHGRYSKYLPKHLLERYHESANDTELLALSDEISLIDARLVDLLKKVLTPESGELWHRLRAAWAEYRKAEKRGDAAAANEARAGLGELIQSGVGDVAIWSEITELIDRRRKLVETEIKRLTAAHSTMSYDHALLFVHRVSNIFREALLEHVTDQAIVRAILNGAAARLAPIVGSANVPKTTDTNEVET